MALLRIDDGDPFSGLLALQRDLERYLRNPNFSLGVSGSGDFPPLNVFADREDQSAVVVAETPGLDASTLNLASQGHTLTINGRRAREGDHDYSGYHRRERPFGEFSRSI